MPLLRRLFRESKILASVTFCWNKKEEFILRIAKAAGTFLSGLMEQLWCWLVFIRGLSLTEFSSVQIGHESPIQSARVRIFPELGNLEMI